MAPKSSKILRFEAARPCAQMGFKSLIKKESISFSDGWKKNSAAVLLRSKVGIGATLYN
jgi:hypothetical protein